MKVPSWFAGSPLVDGGVMVFMLASQAAVAAIQVQSLPSAQHSVFDYAPEFGMAMVGTGYLLTVCAKVYDKFGKRRANGAGATPSGERSTKEWREDIADICATATNVATEKAIVPVLNQLKDIMGEMRDGNKAVLQEMRDMQRDSNAKIEALNAQMLQLFLARGAGAGGGS